jgi:2-(1,2-epoxy-1,2-dihydrophenyl)acetyl-CoA isomerase
MSYETILYRARNGVATITLNRPDKLNALSAQMRVDLAHAIRLATTEARALVLTGAGRAFCSGQDLGEGESIADLDLQRVLRDEYAPLITALAECPIPTVAAVNGAAAGGGASLALAADIVVAAESASFLQAFTRIGLMPDVGATYILPRLVGRARAIGAALLAEEISARQAEEWGMIWEVVPDPLFTARIDTLARRLADGPTEAYRRIKRAFRASETSDLAAQLELEARYQGKLGETRDFVEGATAFIEKRPAKFEGR